MSSFSRSILPIHFAAPWPKVIVVIKLNCAIQNGSTTIPIHWQISLSGPPFEACPVSGAIYPNSTRNSTVKSPTVVLIGWRLASHCIIFKFR